LRLDDDAPGERRDNPTSCRHCRSPTGEQSSESILASKLSTMYDMLHSRLRFRPSYSGFVVYFPAQSIKHSAGQYKVVEEKAFGISEVSTTTTV
jgi:hypothetical protein